MVFLFFLCVNTANLSSVTIVAYFLKDSPDFINYKGESLAAWQQVQALGEAQGIGTFSSCTQSGPLYNRALHAVYLSIFIMQCFNVCPPFTPSPRKIQLTLNSTMPGIRRQSPFLFPLRPLHHRQQVQLLRNHRRCLSRHVHHLHSSSACRLWRFIPPVAALLANSRRVWMLVVGMGQHQGVVDEKERGGGEGEGY